MKPTQLIVTIGLLGLTDLLAAAPAIQYDADSRTIQVQGFSRATPATTADLLAAAGERKWDFIRRNPADQAVTIGANLKIGSSDGAVTWFQIGTTSRPTEAVIMAGNLEIAPPRELDWGRYEGTNGLQIGLPDRAEVHPVLTFACTESARYGIRIGKGAQLLAWNARIGATDPLVPARRAEWSGNANLTGVTLSGFNALDGLGNTYRGCVFENIGRVLFNGSHIAYDCVFRDCGTALEDGGCLYADLFNCRFEGNGQNWTLAYTFRGIRAVDCVFGPPASKKVVCRSYLYPNSEQKCYPVFMDQRHVVFEIRDDSGQPVAGAKVAVRNEQAAPEAVLGGNAVTDGAGRTPAADSGRALFLTREIIRAADDPENPSHNRFTYLVRVEAPGFVPFEQKGFSPDLELPVRVQTVTLHRK